MLRQQWAQAAQRVHERGAEGEAKREGMTRLALVGLIERDRRHVTRGETVGRRKPSLAARAAAGPQPRRKARKSPIAALRLIGLSTRHLQEGRKSANVTSDRKFL